MHHVTRSILLLSMLMLSSCSYVKRQNIVQDRDTQYLCAKSIPPLRIPPCLNSHLFSSQYPVSDRFAGCDANVNILPPGLC